MPARRAYADIGCAKLDTDRCRRRGYAEAVFCQGKSRPHLSKIVGELLCHSQDPILTRLDAPTYRWLKRKFPSLRYHALARIGYVSKARAAAEGKIVVITAGTSDIPVAEEAAVTLEIMGQKAERIYDVGVAGVHRLFASLERIREARVVIVVAGMEGALASLVSGLVQVPVIAVPTSVGYGASFGGLAALLTMLNGCSPGVTVVNIDNGFGAGYSAALMNPPALRGRR
jgi:pyridinium-3,5-biscarboxylic acid mononucleotide synthase